MVSVIHVGLTFCLCCVTCMCQETVDWSAGPWRLHFGGMEAGKGQSEGPGMFPAHTVA